MTDISHLLLEDRVARLRPDGSRNLTKPDRIGPGGYKQAELNAARIDAARLGYGVGLRPARARA